MAFFEQSSWDGRTWIGGWESTGSTAEVVNPATGERLAGYAVASPDDVDRATTLAVGAQREWAVEPAPVRAAVLRRAAALVEQHRDVLAEWIVREGGAAAGKAAFECGLVVDELHHAASTAMMPYGHLLRTGRPRLSIARRRPVGVVGVISPFNFPAILSMRSIAPALALGNAVVHKPDPRTTIAGGLFFAEILAEAGLPAGVFSVVPGRAEVGAALVDEPRIPVISFTGSSDAGRSIGARAGQLLKRAHLELGGNSALVVLEGSDVAAAASAGAWGAFLHQGQICMTTGRHIVHESIYDEYVARLAATAEGLTVGDPAAGAALGPIIDAGQLARVHAIVTDSVAAGARLVTGGTSERLFYRPTVLADVHSRHPAFAKEIFGPVAPVVSFGSVDEAVELANESEYGLSLGILGPDAFAACELADRMSTGIVHINDQTVDDEAAAPFGGVGLSGTGARFGGHEANIEAFTDTQWLTVQGRIETYPF